MLKDKIKKIYKAKVSNFEQLAKSSYFIEIETDNPINAKAGQFISVYCEGLTLRRPFSVFSNNNGKIGILFKEKGKGTKYIKSLKKGDLIDVTGPLGNGFEIMEKRSLLIGAGIGTAPVSFLKTKLDEKGIENIFAAGFLNKDEIPYDMKIDKIYTDDGSEGEKGSILNYLGILINEYKPEIIYTCGPFIVLKTVVQFGEMYGIETQVAMEKVMACAIGVCRGCVIDVKQNGRIVNKTVCKDGPVFNGSEVVWQ